MNPSPQLAKVESAASSRISRLRAVVEPLALPVSPGNDRAVAWAVIEALNVWGGFLRAYYLSGAIRSRTASGSKVYFTSAAFPDKQAALLHAIRLLKNPKFKKKVLTGRDEPSWHDYRNFIRLVGNVGISNLAQIHGAFGYSTTFFEQLAPVRNFYGHRCAETFAKAGKVAIKLGLTSLPGMRACEMMCSRLYGRPQNVITDWLDDMRSVVHLLCL